MKKTEEKLETNVENKIRIIEEEIRVLTESQSRLLNHPVVQQLRLLNAQIETCAKLKTAIQNEAPEKPTRKR